MVDAPDPADFLTFSVWYVSQGYGHIQSMPAFDSDSLAQAASSLSRHDQGVDSWHARSTRGFAVVGMCKNLTRQALAWYPSVMKLTDLIAVIRAQADVAEGDAMKIAKGLIERGLIKGDVRTDPSTVETRACECCGRRFHPSHGGTRYCSGKCVAIVEHL